MYVKPVPVSRTLPKRRHRDELSPTENRGRATADSRALSYCGNNETLNFLKKGIIEIIFSKIESLSTAPEYKLKLCGKDSL